MWYFEFRDTHECELASCIIKFLLGEIVNLGYRYFEVLSLFFFILYIKNIQRKSCESCSSYK